MGVAARRARKREISTVAVAPKVDRHLRYRMTRDRPRIGNNGPPTPVSVRLCKRGARTKCGPDLRTGPGAGGITLQADVLFPPWKHT